MMPILGRTRSAALFLIPLPAALPGLSVLYRKVSVEKAGIDAARRRR